MAATSTELQRRRWLALALLLAVPAAWARPDGNAVPIEVWKSPTCGCGKDWVTHLASNSFKVRTHDVGNTAVRQGLGMPVRLGSCHTASIGGDAIEGHVPAREVHRLLKERPAAISTCSAGHACRFTGHGWPRLWPAQGPLRRAARRQSGSTTAYQRY